MGTVPLTVRWSTRILVTTQELDSDMLSSDMWMVCFLAEASLDQC